MKILKQEGGKMKLMLMVTILAWLILIPASAIISFDVGSATISKYATFQESLRNQAKDANLKCYGIPMLPNSNPNPKYLLIELRAKLSTGEVKTITLMLRRHNLYVMGYSDPIDVNKCRFHTFKDISGTERQDVETTLCPDPNSRVRKDINYDSRYPTMETKAGVQSRSQVQLGIEILNSGIGKISGVSSFTEKTEAGFLLVAIQMVSEAARFKYIENQVKTNFNAGFFPDPKVISLEETWGKTSEAIHGAKNGAFSKPLELVDAQGNKWIVLRVDEIKSDVGLLKYVTGSCQVNYQNVMFPQVIMSYYYNYMANLGDLIEGF